MDQVEGMFLDQTPLKKTTTHVLNLLKKLKKIKSPSFGYLHESDKFEKHKDYDSFIKSPLKVAIKRHNLIEFKKTLNTKINVQKEYIFCHNDLSLKHIYLKDEKIGVIDMEQSFFGSVLIDPSSIIVSLVEDGIKEGIKELLDYMSNNEKNIKVIKFYLERRFILSGCWNSEERISKGIREKFFNISRKLLNCKNIEEIKKYLISCV